ncbi:MAG TPA: aconitate hydratase AcnA [Candidatus Omnitrophica bacterium]|nr:MAG: aconitate hydratase 1 [Omnitrophica WOR_2 bacterium GWA2_45_18]OGX19051.1 MAG: aconitate hydratase 1 [Omnitrophica WOR_2 bacterium GWC2_45_7]HBR14010.1 aconitate hydratase AcnA [Candidatus Omnitrophota bacterium]
MASQFKPKDVAKTLKTKTKPFTIFHLPKLTKLGLGCADHLPFSIKVLLESALRNCDNYQITVEDIKKLAGWTPQARTAQEIAFKPGRVILQDFTGVPCVVDLAAMRSGLKHLGGDYRKINPQVPCDLVIDHSVQVDSFGSKSSLNKNVFLEFRRNKERYEFLKWGQNAFKNFKVVPPSTGIVHQVNLEYLAKGVLQKKAGKETLAFPDSLVGTDSHTTMINGLGIVGWGVGGIEAESVMLGEPLYMLMPEVIGFQLTGRLKEGVTATDLVLTVTQILRQKGVVDKFVEFYGEGLKHLTLPDRATISNMAPEYGATIGLFPIDEETLNYYRLTGRSDAEVDLVERYMKEQGMFYTSQSKIPIFTDHIELDLSSVEPSLAGPKRPQDRVSLSEMKEVFEKSLVKPVKERGYGLSTDALCKSIPINGTSDELRHGSVVIAAITSCTNTSNPSVLIAAGLLAKKTVEKGLKVKSFVKTSLAPGSQVVEEYLRESGLMPYLEKLGFHIVGYGCTTCIGNSGPLPENVAKAIQQGDLVAASVLSGNRNFEGRINPLTKANYLASPPMVVAYALAGSVDMNLHCDPIGFDKTGQAVYLRDIWPTQEEVNQLIKKFVTAKTFRKRYKNVNKGNKNWDAIKETKSDLYSWKNKSTYIQEPPFFISMKKDPDPIKGIQQARVLVMVGDSITTDHISPAGNIAQDSPAGRYLIEQGVPPSDFNSYGARRGNDRVMTRGTFANIRLRNLLAPGTEGSWTMHFPTQEKMSIYDAAMLYKKDATPLVVLAGKEYGTGSSRDWAAKGTALLGVRVVIAQSYERIHRSNLAGMGILPLQFMNGETVESLGLKGDEIFNFEGIDDQLKPRQQITVSATMKNGERKEFKTNCRLDTPVDIDYFRNGGILHTVLRKLAKENRGA